MACQFATGLTFTQGETVCVKWPPGDPAAQERPATYVRPDPNGFGQGNLGHVIVVNGLDGYARMLPDGYVAKRPYSVSPTMMAQVMRGVLGDPYAAASISRRGYGRRKTRRTKKTQKKKRSPPRSRRTK